MNRQVETMADDPFAKFNVPKNPEERLHFVNDGPTDTVIDDLISEMAVQSLRAKELSRATRLLGLAYGFRLGNRERRPELAFLRAMCELIGLPIDPKYDDTRELIKTEFEDHDGGPGDWERLVRGIIGEASVAAADPDKPTFTPDLSHLCESPIETAFYDAAAAYSFVNEGLPFALSPQYHIASYRLDFAIVTQKIAIELDGHDYHKSKEQRSSDAQRDRVLMLAGWRVIRFTGSEIWKDAVGCVVHVVEIAGMPESEEP